MSNARISTRKNAHFQGFFVALQHDQSTRLPHVLQTHARLLGRKESGSGLRPFDEDDRVLLGFWRGQRLIELEPRLRPGGKYEMATIEFRESVAVRPATVRRLAAQAVALNDALGNPARIAKPGRSKAPKRSKK